MAKSLLIIWLVLLCIPRTAAFAADDAGCMATYHQRPDFDCVGKVLSALPQTGAAAESPDTTRGQAVAGFLAEIFQSHPEEKPLVLNADQPRHTRAILIEALNDADLPEEAQAYADRNGYHDLAEQLRRRGWGPVRQLRRSLTPGQNDLLIGAYMASGNTRFIEVLLADFADAGDAMLSDAFRVALMHATFGASVTAPGRPAAMLQAACERYGCKSDMHAMMRMMTLSSGFWAVQSLARQDQGIRDTVAGVLDRDPRLKRILFTEQNAFGNYLSMLALFKAKITNPKVDAALDAFETLKPANDTAGATTGKRSD